MVKETTFNADTEAKQDISLFGKAIFEGGMRIFNFKQENPNDFNLQTNLLGGDASVMLDSKYLVVNKDISVNTILNNNIFLKNPSDACIVELFGKHFYFSLSIVKSITNTYLNTTCSKIKFKKCQFFLKHSHDQSNSFDPWQCNSTNAN